MISGFVIGAVYGNGEVRFSREGSVQGVYDVEDAGGITGATLITLLNYDDDV